MLAHDASLREFKPFSYRRHPKDKGLLKLLLDEGQGPKTQHWGDVRARLELAIEVVLEKAIYLRSVRLQHYRSLELPENAIDDTDGSGRHPGDGQTKFECCTADYRDVS